MLSSFRIPVSRLISVSRVAAVRSYSAAKVETDAEFDSKWVAYFQKSVVSFYSGKFSSGYEFADFTVIEALTLENDDLRPILNDWF